MYYISTRDTSVEKHRYTSAQAILKGLAPDGGLFMPESIPLIKAEEFHALESLDYPSLAARILSLFLTDFGDEELKTMCSDAYSEANFPGGAVQISALDRETDMLELYHGPTCAFKDMALQLMPKLLCASLRKTGEKRRALILVATSGDTGKAALEGFCDTDGVMISVYYPCDGVSNIQKLQMQTQRGSNVNVCAIRGNFDDAQTGVKELFTDSSLATELDQNGVFCSSANSINWGRLVPQIVYYIYVCCALRRSGKLIGNACCDITVPTGNFGNILAAYIAKRMGAPIGKLICASNENHVLTDFFLSGIYDKNRPFHQTASPSMDILISSNLERLIYLFSGPDETVRLFQSLHDCGTYQVSTSVMKQISNDFVGLYAKETDCAEAIRRAFRQGALIDPHTAVAFHCASLAKQAGRRMVVVSTASPYKFAQDVLSALDGKAHDASFETQDLLSSFSGVGVPAPLASLRSLPIRFSSVIEARDMKHSVLRFTRG